MCDGLEPAGFGALESHGSPLLHQLLDLPLDYSAGSWYLGSFSPTCLLILEHLVTGYVSPISISVTKCLRYTSYTEKRFVLSYIFASLLLGLVLWTCVDKVHHDRRV